jgi:hypothetical protein
MNRTRAECPATTLLSDTRVRLITSVNQEVAHLSIVIAQPVDETVKNTNILDAPGDQLTCF